MALSKVTFCLGRNASMSNWLSSASKVFVAAPIQVATLRATYGEKYPYPKPWPYKTRKFNVFWDLLDIESRKRLGENSKVICIEGNIGVGKNKFAKRLAKEFDLQYIPSVTEDDIFTLDFEGFDERMLDPLIEMKSARTYGIPEFLTDPHPEKGRVGLLQSRYCQQKFYQYATGLLHLLNTGQGFVIAGSAWNDKVFLEAFRQLGWVTQNYIDYYYDIHDNAFCDLMRPHVSIYLDAPVDVCMERIKARNRPEEMQGEKNLKQLLPALENSYKGEWIKQHRKDHVVMELDWTEVGDDMDFDVIAEEIEGLNLECFNADDPMFKDWYRLTEDEVAEKRHLYQNFTRMKVFFEREQPWKAPEAMYSSDELGARQEIIRRHPILFHGRDKARELGNKPEWHIY